MREGSLRGFGRCLAWCVVAAAGLAVGCGYPAAEPMNLELISSLRTALSARNEEWLAANEKIIDERHAAGEMRDDEFAAFKKIVGQAHGGDWEGAEHATLAFQKSQRPTREQVERIRAERQ